MTYNEGVTHKLGFCYVTTAVVGGETETQTELVVRLGQLRGDRK